VRLLRAEVSKRERRGTLAEPEEPHRAADRTGPDVSGTIFYEQFVNVVFSDVVTEIIIIGLT